MIDALSPEALRAKEEAERTTSIDFGQTPVTGYAARSYVFLSADDVLKIFTHRPEDRLQRELHGLDAAAKAPGIEVPHAVASGQPANSHSWLVTTRLPGVPVADEARGDSSTSRQLGTVAARLHAAPDLTDLPVFNRPVAEPADRLLRLEEGERRLCDTVIVHGDFSGRNVLLTPGHKPGLIDFEGSGTGCRYEDIATLVTREALLGQRAERDLVDAYAVEAGIAIDHSHLSFHIAWYLSWILQWSATVDPRLHSRVQVLLPGLLDEAHR